MEPDAEASGSSGGSPLKRAWGACFSTLASAETADLSAGTPLKRGHEYAKTTRDIEERAEQLAQEGLQPLDALHVASAESLKADVLLTCDDRFIKAARRLASQLKVKVLNPIELVPWRQR